MYELRKTPGFFQPQPRLRTGMRGVFRLFCTWYLGTCLTRQGQRIIKPNCGYKPMEKPLSVLWLVQYQQSVCDIFFAFECFGSRLTSYQRKLYLQVSLSCQGRWDRYPKRGDRYSKRVTDSFGAEQKGGVARSLQEMWACWNLGKRTMTKLLFGKQQVHVSLSANSKRSCMFFF